MKMNILHVVTTLEDGGLEKVVYLLAAGIKDPQIKHLCAVLVNKRDQFLKKDFISEGVKVLQFNFSNKMGTPKGLFRNSGEIFKLALFIKQNKISIIHSHDFFPAFISRTAAVLSFIFLFHKTGKIFITLHNSMSWLGGIHHFINKILSLFTTKIICVSDSVKEYSAAKDKIPESKYCIIYNGVNVQEYSPDNSCQEIYRKEFHLNENDIVIGNVGVLSVRKGQKYLLSAFKKLTEDFDNIKLLIFGSRRNHESEVADEIYNLITDLKLSMRVQIISPRKDLNKIYNLFDLFVMPSITEGLSLSAIEAMLMEKVCLFSDIPPFHEMISDGHNGFLFKSEDTVDLYEKMKIIINNLDSYKITGKTARTDALQKYSSERMINEYRNLYFR